MKKAMNFVVLGMILLLVGIVSAQVNFMGTVYEDTTPTPTGLSGVSITVNCNGTNSGTVKSLVNGAYGTTIPSCSNGDDLVYTVSLPNYESTTRGVLSGSFTGKYNSSLEISLVNDSIYIVDFILSKKSVTATSTGSSGGCTDRVWTCESWSECNGVSQTRDCTSNCGRSREEIRACVIEEEVEEEEQTEIVENINANEETPSGFFSTITGAVIGGGATTWSVATIFLVLVIGGFGFVKLRKK